MGRPKKGEISYRKPLKKNGIKQIRNSEQQMMGSNRSSVSSEYDQDEASTSDDVFDHISAGQHQQMLPNHHQMSSPLQQQQQQQLHQQLQPQAASGFSLGSILHECMTVQDWDPKVEMAELDQDRGPPHTVGIPASSSAGSSLSEEVRQISPHLQQRVLSQRHQVVYQDPNQNPENLGVIASMEYVSEHELPVNRAIKVENVPLQDGPEGPFAENVVLEDMQNLQTITKSEFQSYQLQDIDPNSQYVVNEQRASTSPGSGATLIPITQIEPSVSSQIVAINMSSQNVIYTPHNHDPIIIRNVTHHHPSQNINLIQNHQGLEQSQLAHEIESGQDDMEQGQRIGMNSIEDHHVITSQDIIRATHHSHVRTSDSQFHSSGVPRGSVEYSTINSNNMRQPQFHRANTGVASSGSDSPHPSDSMRSRTLRTDEQASYTFIPTSAPHTLSSVLSTSNSSPIIVSSTHPTISGIRSPIAAILQQHKDAIQAGRPVQLSPEEIEELLITVNAEHARRLLSNEEVTSKGQRVTAHPNSVDIRRHVDEPYVVSTDRHSDSGNFSGQQAGPNSISAARNYQNSSPSGQYSPISQSMVQAQRRQYPDHKTSPASDSSNQDRQDYAMGCYPSPSVANNNNHQVSHYISHNAQAAHNNDLDQQGDMYDDSFNSALIRDSTLLHEINRIFLGIDNSCDTYGCNRQMDEGANRAMDDSTVVSCMSPDEFSPDISHRYWHGLVSGERFMVMTAERRKIIQDVLDAFDNLQRTYVTTEPENIHKKVPHDQLDHWHHIQRRIARHVVAGQRFCRNIPGYFKLDIQDRISLGKHVGFGLMVLIACTEFYDPEFKRFKYIWNWTMPMQNPLFSYKYHLLSLGNKIHDIEVDRTEASMMCAISMTSIDCPGLVKPDIVCVVRDALIDALKAHISAKNECNLRLKSLLSIMPQVRLMTVWYNNLMKKMSIPSDMTSNKLSKPLIRQATGTENTPNYS